MRRPTLMLGRLLGAAPILLLASAAWAREPGTIVWDDRHMQSNFAARSHTPSQRPPIQIGDPAPSHAQVRETILSISPHGWRPGPEGFGASTARGVPQRAGTAQAARTSSVRSSSWSQGARHGSLR